LTLNNLPKWEDNEPTPTLLHISSLPDLAVFGIGERNYGNFVLDRADWERQFSFNTATLPQGTLVRASQATGSALVLLRESFDNAASDVLPNSSPQPSRYTAGYEEGEYRVNKLLPGGPIVGRVGGIYVDASVAVDARIIGPSADRLVFIGCRRQPGPQASYYGFLVAPASGLFAIVRWDNDTQQNLVEPRRSSAIRSGNDSNRLELRCAGSSISALVNGVIVASVQDSKYVMGHVLVGGDTPRSDTTFDIRFDNLLVTQL
jgi:hypothetical protein